jgi:predicted HicB family RNase H-like nuclease
MTTTEQPDLPSDGKEDIALNLDRDELYQLMLLAHEQDVTLNQLVETMLREHIDQHEKNN